MHVCLFVSVRTVYILDIVTINDRVRDERFLISNTQHQLHKRQVSSIKYHLIKFQLFKLCFIPTYIFQLFCNLTENHTVFCTV